MNEKEFTERVEKKLYTVSSYMEPDMMIKTDENKKSPNEKEGEGDD